MSENELENIGLWIFWLSFITLFLSSIFLHSILKSEDPKASIFAGTAIIFLALLVLFFSFSIGFYIGGLKYGLGFLLRNLHNGIFQRLSVVLLCHIHTPNGAPRSISAMHFAVIVFQCARSARSWSAG